MMIKICTSIEQSKILAGILPPKSADMCYLSKDGRGIEFFEEPDVKDGTLEDCDIRAWSLVALLMEMPNIIAGCIKTLRLFDNAWHCCFIDTKTSKCLFDTSAYEPVDACVEMILKLHERRLL